MPSCVNFVKPWTKTALASHHLRYSTFDILIVQQDLLFGECGNGNCFKKLFFTERWFFLKATGSFPSQNSKRQWKVMKSVPTREKSRIQKSPWRRAWAFFSSWTRHCLHYWPIRLNEGLLTRWNIAHLQCSTRSTINSHAWKLHKRFSCNLHFLRTIPSPSSFGSEQAIESFFCSQIIQQENKITTEHKHNDRYIQN